MKKEKTPRGFNAAGHSSRHLLIASAGLALLVLLIYLPVVGYDFVVYDDSVFIYENPHLRNGITIDAVRWALTADLLHDSLNADYYIPLTFLSRLLDAQLFGMNAGGHHLTNLLLHAANVILLFLVFARTTGFLWRSALVAALFAAHPMHVESVAWVTERKDVLSGLFGILTLWSYWSWVEKRNHSGKGASLHYVAAILLFLSSLLSKPMMVALPLLLLVSDFWPLNRIHLAEGKASIIRRITALGVEKIPFLLLSLLFSWITWRVQFLSGAAKSLDSYALEIRILNAIQSYAEYVYKLFWPVNLSVFYPHPGESLKVSGVLLPFCVLAAITAVAFRLRRRFPFLLAGWLWFVLALLPVIGIVQSGDQSMADRYTYFPYLGLYAAMVWLVADLRAAVKRGSPLLWSVPVLGVLTALTLCSCFQVRHWKNSITLFEKAIHSTRNNHVALNNLASAHSRNGNRAKAMEYYSRALEIEPSYIEARYNLALELGNAGNLDAGIAQLQEVLRIDPSYAQAHYGLGNFHLRQDLLDQALVHYQETVRLRPAFVDAHNNLAILYARIQQPREAMMHFEKALELKPGDAELHYNYGLFLKTIQEFDLAIRHLSIAAELKPDDPQIQGMLDRARSEPGFLTPLSRGRESRVPSKN